MAPPPIQRTLSFIVAAMLGMLCVQSAYAQNTYAARQALLTALNQKLNDLRQPGTTSVALTSTDIAPLSLLGVDGSCLSVIGDPIIAMTKDGANVVLTIQTAAAATMDIPPGSHNLVCDLQIGWLKRWWGYPMRRVIATHRIGIDVNSPCYTNSQFTQKYMMWGVGSLEETANRPIKDTLANWLADWQIEGKQYRVVTDKVSESEADMGGRCVFRESPDVNSTDKLVYIAKRIQTGGIEEADAKPAYSHVEFAPGYTMDERKVVKAITIEARAQRNQPSDCFPGSPPAWLLAPDVDKAFVQITYLVKDFDNAGLETPHTIRRTFQAGTAEQNNDALWAFFDSEVQYEVDAWCNFEIDNEGYLTFTAKPSGANHTCTLPGTFRIMRLRSNKVPAQECQFTFSLDDDFRLDGMTGEIVCRHVDNGVETFEPIPCLQFCTTLSGYRTMSNVIAASAQRFGYSWPYDASEFITGKVLDTWVPSNTSNNIYELNQARWRPIEGYAYRTSTLNGGKIANPAERIYNSAGVFLNDAGTATDAFRLFDWRNPAANTGTKWLLGSTVTLASPFGQPLEEMDILGIYSAAKLSHRNMVPRLVAKNARYTSVGYESFEDGNGDVNTAAHTGRWSLRMGANYPATGVMRLTVTEQMRAQGVLVRLWVKQTYANYNPNALPVQIDPAFGTGTLEKIAQTGEWTLYEQVCNVSTHTAGTAIDLKVKSLLWPPGNGSPNDEVWIDDVRAQPFDAEMMCYVYDPATLRLVAQLDDQHFAVLYQYNGEGKLVRTLRETERGVMTVEERQYHIPDMYMRNGTPASQAQFAGGNPSSGTMRFDTREGGGEGDGTADGMGGQFDLLDMSIGADGVKTKILGVSPSDLSRFDLDSLRSMFHIDTSRFNASQLERLDAAGLSDVEKIKDLMAVREIDRRMAALESKSKEELSEAERREIESASAELQEQRRKLMQERLGVDEDGLRDLYRSLEEVETEESKTEDSGVEK